MHIRGSSTARRSNEEGASLVEYGLLLALIAVVCFGAVSFFGTEGDNLMTRNHECITGAMDQNLPADCDND